MKKYTIIGVVLAILLILGGWIVLAQLQTSNSSGVQTTDASNSTTNTYTLADIATHKSASSCWMAINGSVYDVTKFIPIHQGGNQILQGCGTDATALFESQPHHESAQAQNTLPKYKIGILAT